MTQILERFNSVYSQFFDELRKEFNLKISNDINYLDDYIKYILPYMDNISVCNEDFLKLTEPHLHLTHNVSFHNIMTHEKYETNKISFWKYLHTLYLLSTKLDDEIINNSQCNSQVKAVISSKENILENIKKYKPEFVFIPTQKATSGSTTTTESSKKADEIMDDLNEDDNEGAEFFKSSMIGKLAEDLSKEFNPEEFNPEEFKDLQNPMDLLGVLFKNPAGSTGENNQHGMGMENILKKVCNKMDEKLKNGELNHEALMKDAQKLMGSMFAAPQGGNSDPNQFRQAGMMNMMNMMNMMMPKGEHGQPNGQVAQKVSKKNKGKGKGK